MRESVVHTLFEVHSNCYLCLFFQNLLNCAFGVRVFLWYLSHSLSLSPLLLSVCPHMNSFLFLLLLLLRFEFYIYVKWHEIELNARFWPYIVIFLHIYRTKYRKSNLISFYFRNNYLCTKKIATHFQMQTTIASIKNHRQIVSLFFQCHHWILPEKENDPIWLLTRIPSHSNRFPFKK